MPITPLSTARYKTLPGGFDGPLCNRTHQWDLGKRGGLLELDGVDDEILPWHRRTGPGGR